MAWIGVALGIVVGDRGSADEVAAVNRQRLGAGRARRRVGRHAAHRRRGGGHREAVGTGTAASGVDHRHGPSSAITCVVERRVSELTRADEGGALAWIRIALGIVVGDRRPADEVRAGDGQCLPAAGGRHRAGRDSAHCRGAPGHSERKDRTIFHI